MADDEEPIDLEEEISNSEIALHPSENADPSAIVNEKIPKDILEKYEVHSYRNAAVILCETRKEEFSDLLTALREFKINTTMIRTAGGNESEIPKLLSKILRPMGWHETVVQGDLLVRKIWKEDKKTKQEELLREKYLDGHKVDYVKGKVAFDLEWNSKDQTFDRDLYAFSAFSQCGVIDVAVLVTRSASLNPVFRELGESLKKDGTIEYKSTGKARMTHEKYGASTTWMGKLLYRLNAGRNGGCPVLVIGITPNCIEDWKNND